ncbi:MAG TPA: hypothetical protein VL588_07815 [Bdellovibrionota bacterium]|nr:hypothetical protein [Bdellovibrionota bacterium]
MSMRFLPILMGIVGLGLGGCLESPLLDHVQARDLEAVVSPATTGCALSFAKLKLCASLEWVHEPVDENTGEFTLRFWNPATGTEHGPYVSPTAPSTELKVKLWMPAMGHGSSPVTVTPAVDAAGSAVEGIFEATGVYFVMGGHWEIWAQIKQGTTIVDQAKVTYEAH